MRICFDLDGVIATTVSDGNYENAEPIWETIHLLNDLHERGHTIIIATARGFASKKDWRELTLKQLSTWGVHFSEFYINKVGADYYIDDKNATVNYIRLVALHDLTSEEKGNES